MLLLLLVACEWRLTDPSELPLLGNCDGDAEVVPLFRDVDGDGQGELATVRQGCVGISGWVEEDGDCDDDDPAVYAGAPEQCNDLDDDCDLTVDEAPERLWCVDRDLDGY